jgi:polysaccharide export outer membrane protein
LKKYLTFLAFGLSCWFAVHPAIAEDGRFHIGPGDVIEISVWKDDTLNRDVVVPPDRMISYALIGDIDTTGMTITDLRKEVTRKLVDYVPDATVTVILKSINSLKAYVVGKVNSPGMIAINMDTTVMQALAMTGGLNPFASEGKIHILRRQKNMTIKIPFNYKQVLKGENLKQNIVPAAGGCCGGPVI